MATFVIDHNAARTQSGDAPDMPRRTPARPALEEQAAVLPVSVNGVAIPHDEIAAEVQNFPSPNPGEAWRAAARALVIRELLLQEARRLGLVADPQTDGDGCRETDDDALVRVLIAREVRVPVADEATVRRFYERNPHRFRTPPLYEADHILLAARRDDHAAFATAQARAASLSAILAAEPAQFSSLARTWSDCPSATVGGSLGQIGPGDTTAEFEAALTELAPGAVSAPVETRYGVHVIRLVRRIDGRVLPFEAVRDRIAASLEEQVHRRATAQYISLLVGRADIRGVSLAGSNTPLVQ